MNLLAIDPGNEQSAFVCYTDGGVFDNGKIPNDEMMLRLCEIRTARVADALAIEMVACYGMAVGAEVFETCVWIGRFIQAWGDRPCVKVYRKDVKMHLCNSMKAKDGNIRQALIDRYGGSKAKAIGLKKTPGPLYGLSGDQWSALAVAETAIKTGLIDTQRPPAA